MDTTSFEAALDAVRAGLDEPAPYSSLVLGSGWGDVVDSFPVLRTLPYGEIPGLEVGGVEGHAGRIVLAECEGRHLLIFQGRRHWYEGLGWAPVAIPAFLARSLGASSIVLTNAAGGIRAGLRPGTLMLLEDHINAMGANPLQGAHDAFWGPRFPDQTAVYDPDLRREILASAEATGVALEQGVYLAASGPAYETPAEIRTYASWGADAVGMSTVPEAMLAHAAGLRVAAISCITNLAAGLSPKPLHHEEVLSSTREALPAMAKLLGEFFLRLARGK